MACKGNFHEIYKTVRDGLHSDDKSYKHLCLEIILQHLYYISREMPNEMYHSTPISVKSLYDTKEQDFIEKTTSLSSAVSQEKGSSASD